MIALQNNHSPKFSDNPDQGDYLKIIIVMLIGVTCIGFTFQVLQTSLPKVIDIRLTEVMALDTAKIGLVVSSIYVVSGLMNYVGGIAADRYSVRLIYAYGMLLQGLLLFVFADMNHISLILFAFCNKTEKIKGVKLRWRRESKLHPKMPREFRFHRFSLHFLRKLPESKG